MREHKLATSTKQISRNLFLSVLSHQLFSGSFLPEHLVGGFRGAGIYLLSSLAIKIEGKNSSSLCTSIRSVSTIPATSMAPTVTATRQRVELYFTKYFEQKAEEKKAKAKTRIRPKHYGEAFTENDIFERIKQEQDAREQRKQTKGRKIKQKQEIIPNRLSK